jgi:hypothetical protein
VKNQEIKDIRKAARKYERERWAKIINEIAFKKDLKSDLEYTHQVLVRLADCMVENKRPKFE